MRTALPFLVKTYFDTVSPTGRWAIAYDVRLPAGPFELAYRELATSDCPRTRGQFAVQVAGKPFSPHFAIGDEVSANWVLDELTRPLVLETPMLRWELEGLRGAVEVRTSRACWIGLGYRERVILKNSPWRVGLRRLSWGRFISDRHFMTWIVASGRDPINFGILNNSVFDHVELGEQVVRFGPAELRLQERVSMVADVSPFTNRSGLIRALAVVRGGGGFDLQQIKEVRACILHVNGRDVPGTAMIEEVRFGSNGRQPREAVP